MQPMTETRSNAIGADREMVKAVAVIPGKANTIHLREVPKPKVEDVPGGRGVLIRILRVGVDGTDKEINAAEYGAAPSGDNYKLPSVLNKDEAELVLKQPSLEKPLGIRDRAMLEVLYSTGIRRMELVNLKLYDVDQKYGLVSIREGKGKRDRIVPVGERALFWLDKYLTEVRPSILAQPHDPIVFLTATGEPFTPNHLSWLARRYLRATGIGKTGACHIFRHTMATLMLEGGADIRYIQAMLGRVRLDTTQIYTHVSIRMLKQVHAATHPAARLESLKLPRRESEGPVERGARRTGKLGLQDQ